MSTADIALSQVRQQRLNRLHAGVLTISVDDLARQGLGDAGFGGYAIPCAGANLPKTAFDVLDDGFHDPHRNPVCGICASPHMGLCCGQCSDMRPRDIIAANIRSLTEGWDTPNKHKALHKASEIPNGTLERIEKATVSAGVDWLEPLASALGVEPWELLVPPERRAQLRALYNALQATAGPAAAPAEPQRKRSSNGA